MMIPLLQQNLQAAGTTNATATGTVPALSLTAPTASAAGTTNATATGLVPSVTLSAPTASAAGTTNATATGLVPSVTLSAPTGAASATGNGLASGEFAVLALFAPEGLASGTSVSTLPNTDQGVARDYLAENLQRAQEARDQKAPEEYNRAKLELDDRLATEFIVALLQTEIMYG